MVSNNFPFLKHQHLEGYRSEGKDHTIWLPRSSQLGSPPEQPGKARNQYFEIYLCSACGLVSEYRPLSIDWRRVQNGDQAPTVGLYAVAVVFQCGECTRESRVLIRKPTTDTQATTTLLEESKLWILGPIHCPIGHLVTQIPSTAVARTDSQLGLI